jgi:tetratricopeptide (TPR) repeat protein
MSKKKRIKEAAPIVAEKKAVLPQAVDKGPWYTTFLFQALLLVIVGFLCFANSIKNQYALDDDTLIVKNQYVQEGVKGIPKILSNDAMQSFYDQWGGNQALSGGRYRPLSIIVFATEQQLFGSEVDSDSISTTLPQPAIIKQSIADTSQLTCISHAVNIILYILSVLVLLYFLRNFIFKEQPLVPFLTALLFIVHPVHTEVVANIKSLDEILSFLFFILTFIYAFRYHETEKKNYLWLSLSFYFLALLAKEYAISIVVLLPMLFYIVKKDSLAKSLVRTIPFFAVMLLYVIIRVSIVGLGNNTESTELLDNPFLFASGVEKLATKILILDKYLWLLIHPAVLSSDYSYNTIPYTDFSDIAVWLSLIILIAMIVVTIILFRKRNIIAFALAFYLIHLFLVSNLVFDLGATMGERLIYHSSLGFVMILAIGINYALAKIPSSVAKASILAAGCLLLVAWCAAKDMERNAEWYNNPTLSLADVKKYPNSCMLNSNAGNALIDSARNMTDSLKKREVLSHAIILLEKAIAIHPLYEDAYLNLGSAHYLNDEYDSAMQDYNKVKKIYPRYPNLSEHYAELGTGYNNRAILLGDKDKLLTVHYFEKALACEPDNIIYLNNLAIGYYFVTNEPEKAKHLWQRSLQISPGNPAAIKGMELFDKK